MPACLAGPPCRPDQHHSHLTLTHQQQQRLIPISQQQVSRAWAGPLAPAQAADPTLVTAASALDSAIRGTAGGRWQGTWGPRWLLSPGAGPSTSSTRSAPPAACSKSCQAYSEAQASDTESCRCLRTLSLPPGGAMALVWPGLAPPAASAGQAVPGASKLQASC